MPLICICYSMPRLSLYLAHILRTTAQYAKTSHGQAHAPVLKMN